MNTVKRQNSLPCRKAAYTKENFRAFSDAKLAKVLNVDKRTVRDYLAANRLSRTAEEEGRIRENSQEPPAYLAEIPLSPNCFPLSGKHLAFALLVFCASFLAYFHTLAPTITGEDSGELITAAYALGIAHPPGYPLWCLLGKLFAVAIPYGNVASRVNLMSAFWASAAVAALFLVAFKLTGSITASLGASLSFGFFADFWAQAVIAEVYALNVFLIALILLILVSYYHLRFAWLIPALAFASGLALVHHNTTAPIVFLAWASVVYISPKRILKPNVICLSILLLIASISVLLYLPIRSAANPPMDWGNPETLRSMLDHILRQQYAFGYTERPRTLLMFMKQLSIFGQLASSQVTILFPIMALAGLGTLWKRDKQILVFLAAIVLVCGPVLIFVINFEVEREAAETVKPFFLPVYVAMAILCAVFLGSVAGFLSSRKTGRFAPALIPLIALIPLLRNHHESNKSNYYYAYDYGRNLFATMDRNAIIFSSSDHTTFPLIYLQSVEGMRPDVAIADKYGYIEKDLYEQMPRETTSTFRNIPTPQERHMVEHWIMTNTSRPIFFTKKRDMQNLPGSKLIPWGLAYKLVRETDPLKRPAVDLWSLYELRTLNDTDSHKDYTAYSILCDYHFARGRESLYNGKTKEALKDFELVAKYGWGVKEIFNNLGSVCAENSLVDDSMGYFEQALEIDPNYLLALNNLAKLSEHMGNYPKALDYTKRILETHPDDSDAVLHLAGLYERAGDIENAVKTYQNVMRLAPDDFRPFRSLGYIYLSVPNARQEALQMFSESLRRNPNQPDLRHFLAQARLNDESN